MNRNGGKASLKVWGSPEDSKVVIYIDKQAYDDINRHGAANPEREIVGILLGNFSEDGSGKYRVDVVGIVKSESAPGNKTQAQFTHEVWLQLVESAKRDYPNQKVVGWYHTHPGFGAFMSDDDVNSHRLAFSNPWHVAAVCDPIKNELCFFGWDDSEIKAIKGFYTYEVPAKEPKLLPSPERKTPSRTKAPAFLIPVLVLFVALFTIIGLAFTVWLPGEQKKTSQPPFKDFPAAVVSFRNADKEEVYNYYFTQNNGEVWRYTLNKEEPWDKETPLPITLKEIVGQPTVNKQGDSGNTIGTLELQAKDEKGELWLLSTDILTDGKLAEWQQTEKTAIPPATGISLSVSPPYLFFGTTKDAIPLQLSLTGNGNLSWQIFSTPAGINVDKESGVGNATINVTMQRSELSPGDHMDKIILSYNGDKMMEEVPTFVTVASATVPAQKMPSFRIISVKDKSDDGKISRGGEKILVVVQNIGQSSGEVEVSINSSEIFAILESPEAQELKPDEELTFLFLLKPSTMRSGISEILVFKAKNLTSTADEYDEESERFFAP
ncbi:MAG: Mov34/MPN/PAD-1 family protein [Dehalococcoidia bacterium]|nr:Mov34/MPN/PAD-1 family protein [Dehalococcoidia bacterium]